MSKWSLRWHFTNKSVTEAPYSIIMCCRPILCVCVYVCVWATLPDLNKWWWWWWWWLIVTVCHTAEHHGEEYDDWNGAVLRSRRNCSSDGGERTDDGRAFHARAAVTGKARSPSVVRRVDGMTSVDVETLKNQLRSVLRLFAVFLHTALLSNTDWIKTILTRKELLTKTLSVFVAAL